MTSLLGDVIAQQFDSPAYQLLNKIGEGGFGRVYRAKQTNTGQIVAIKFLSLSSEFDETKKARYSERFERETLLGSRLQHPNIVRLLDKGSCGNLLYAVFEYVDGKSLKETLVESGSLAPIATAEVMSQVLDALAHAHQQGVIHRDIKPANIMLSKSGTKTHAKVLDFGIGTLVNEARLQDYKSITLTQETLGTPSYSAPEQLRGEPPTLKTDLYVWGLVFIECLTGQPAMSGTSIASVFHKQLSQAHVPLPASIMGHPLAALLRRVLHKKAHERCVNAQELYQDLNQINFSNLVGEMVAEKEQQSNHDLTQINSSSDETMITDKALFHTGLTERKQITALSINLTAHAVGSDSIDYEIVDTLLRDQKNQCLDTAIRYGAFHVGTLADSMLFYFGYPAVSDNDSRLSARTALDIISSLQKRNALLKTTQGVELDVRIGLHTDLVTCYADATPEGNTANIAMQLARLANKGKILCSAASQKILQTYIEFEPTHSAILGINGNESVLFNLTAERHVEAFGFLRGTQNNHAFIGRKAELKQLNRQIEHCLNKNSHATKLTHIYGEAGIGKSRLIFELRNRAKQFSHYVAQCLPEHQNNALYPILNVIKYKFSLDALAPELALQKLRSEIAKLAVDKEQDAIPVLSAWLGLPLPKELPASTLSPELQKQVLFDILTTLLLDNDTQASLFIFEDMHWADPTSLEFIASFSADKRFISANALFISTSRQPRPELLSESNFELLNLVKLTEEDTREFVHRLFSKQNISANLLEVIVTRSDGIPLFIEELVNMLKQNGLVHKLNGIYDFISPDKLEQVPSSLRDSLQQKLDTLVSAKETAQLAATIGREFDYDLLVSASKHSEAQVQNDLHELLDAELIYQQRKVSGDSYIFKHALVRDAAYESMVQEARGESHKRVAQSFDCSFPEFCRKNPSIIANHYAMAMTFENATKYGLLAAKLAMTQSSENFAVKCLQDSLQWNSNIVDLELKYENELAINSALIPALMVCEGYGANEFDRIAKRSNEIFKIFSNKEKSGAYKDYAFNILWGVFLFHNNRSLRVKPFEVAMQMREMALENEDVEQQVFADAIVGFCDWNDGRFIDAKSKLEKVISKYNSANFSGNEFAIRFGLDPKSWSLAILSFVYWSMGYSVLSMNTISESITWADHISHVGNLSYSNTCYSILLYQQDDKKSLLELESQQTELENKFGAQFVAFLMRVPKDWATASSEYSIGFLDQYWGNGLRTWAPILETILATTLLERSEESTALARLKPMFDWVLTSGEQCYLAKMYLLHAMLQAKDNKEQSSKVNSSFSQSIEIALEQGIYYQALESSVKQIEYQTVITPKSIPNEMLTQLELIINKIPEDHDSVIHTKALQIVNKKIYFLNTTKRKK